MSLILWTQNFLIGQGFHVTDNVVYQDNQSAMLLEKNGKCPVANALVTSTSVTSSLRTNIHKKHLRVEYCPTDDMIGDFFTNPLQGSKFRSFRNIILGCQSGDVPNKIKELRQMEQDSVMRCPDVTP
jgi:hypothetical protein